MIKKGSARQNFTPTERDRFVREYRRGQLSQKEFARHAGIGVTTLQSWLRRAAGPGRTPGPKFVPVPNLLGAPPGRAAYRLHLTGGLQLEISSGFLPEELTTLLRTVREL